MLNSLCFELTTVVTESAEKIPWQSCESKTRDRNGLGRMDCTGYSAAEVIGVMGFTISNIFIKFMYFSIQNPTFIIEEKQEVLL